MKSISGLVLSAVTAAFLVGCGGGGGSSSGGSNTSNTSSINYGGSVIDGYIQNAVVCLDLSLDGVCDNSEPSAKTDSNGAYSLTITPEQQAHQNFNIAPIVAYGGTDKDTGNDFIGMLQAQVSGTTANVTPLTTVLSKLVQEEVSSATSKTDLESKITAKKELVRTAFGLPSGVNISDDFKKSGNLELTKTATEIQKTVDLITNVGSDGSVEKKELAKSIFNVIKDKVKSASANSDVLTSTVEEVKTTTISGFVFDTSAKDKLEIGQNDIKEILKKVESVNDIEDYVSYIDDRKKEIEESTNTSTLVKYTSTDILTGDDLKIISLKNFLEVIGVNSSVSKNKAELLFAQDVTKSNLIEKFTSTSESDIALQTTYSGIKTLVDAYVAKLAEDAKIKSYAVQAIEVLEKMNIETDNINNKITAAKNLVNGLTENDAVMVRNMLDLTKTFESDTVKNLVDVKVSGVEDTLSVGKIVKSTVKNAITFSPKYNGITTNSRTVMHDLATQLKTISDSIGTVFTNKDYVFAYGNEQITYNDSLVVRGVILAVAFKLDFIASYSWGTDDDIKTQTRIIGNMNFEYQNINIDPATVLNAGKTFKMDSAARLEGARAYLIEGLTLVNTLPEGYNDLTTSDKTDLANILSSVNGNGSYELVDTQENYSWDFSAYQMNPNYRGTWTTTTEKYYVDLSKLLNSTYALDITSFGSNFKMTCGENMQVSEKYTITYNKSICVPVTSQVTHIEDANISAETKPTTDNSRLDDVITKIIDQNGQELTGQNVIDFLVGNN